MLSSVFRRLLFKRSVQYYAHTSSFSYAQTYYQSSLIQPNALNIRHMERNESDNKYEIGQCKQVRIKCVSEIGWFNNDTLLANIADAGGLKTANQWNVKWDEHNSAGSCSLVEITHMDDTKNKFLIDSGWNEHYMDTCFKREGIDDMLRNNDIDFVFVTHEHVDHLWGIRAVLKYNKDIKIVIPNTFSSAALKFLKECNIVSIEAHKLHRIFNGCAAFLFADIEEYLGICGESSLYFDVNDKGFVCLSGCCHQGVDTLVDFAVKNIQNAEQNMYGIYGGLHIEPFKESLNETQLELIENMQRFEFKKIACNHCTGIAAVRKMRELGYPVVSGTAKYGTIHDLYIGNGDEIIF